MKISTGTSSTSKKWKTADISWLDFLKRVNSPIRTKETYQEYISMPADQQHAIKDVGGFVAGELLDGRRSKGSVVSRSALTLDLDNADNFVWDAFTFMFSCEAVLHGTHKHSQSAPRYRLIIPTSRPVTPLEYEAITRKVADLIGMHYFDKTTFDPSRLMFWPSISSDADWFIQHQIGEFLNPDDVLQSYKDYRDISEWPYPKGSDVKITSSKKAECPTSKDNIVGLFCRAYTIHDAISNFLSETYTPAIDKRYTYVFGSGSNGVVTYDDMFAYSHHSTDPAEGRLCNAFDLVRIHKFGGLDKGKKYEDSAKSKSYKAMVDFARSCLEVQVLDREERLSLLGLEDACRTDNRDRGENISVNNTVPNAVNEGYSEGITDNSWIKRLSLGKSGYNATASNISIIMKNDPAIKGVFVYDTFSSRRKISRSTPWRRTDGITDMNDADYSGLRIYLENVYGIVSSSKIEDAVNMEFEHNQFHPVKSYLSSLHWDGVARLDTLLHDVLGVPQSVYSAEAFRKTMVALVARVFEPGKKFDYVLTLVGSQGLRKSTFFSKLGGNWYSDSFSTMDGKEAFEQLQGSWLIEMAELSGYTKSDVESVKHFLSKRTDRYRPAYGRTVNEYPRQCVFVATTNTESFLKDPTGNRRFWPFRVDIPKATIKIESKEFDDMIPQLFAEAVHLYHKGETLTLSDEGHLQSEASRETHFDTDDRTGLLEEYLKIPIPLDWETYDVNHKKRWIESEEIRSASKVETKERDAVSALEICVECFGYDIDTIKRHHSREVNEMMRTLKGWESMDGLKRTFKGYGRQKYYARKST